MLSASRRVSRLSALLILLSASGCSLFSCVYLHDDAYQQKADTAQTDFNKIDLTSKFNDQFTKVTSYDNDEDQAVAALQVAARNQQLQDFIQLPAWSATNNCHDLALAVRPNLAAPEVPRDPGPAMPCSGPKALRYSVQKDLKRLTGHTSLSNDQIQSVRDALYLAPNDALALEADRAAIANDLAEYKKLFGTNSFTSCPANAPVSAAPSGPPYDADYYWKDIQSFCGLIARDSRSQSLTALTSAVAGGQDDQSLSQLLQSRETALQKQQINKKQADELAKQIKNITDSNSKSSTYADLLPKIAEVKAILNNDKASNDGKVPAQVGSVYYKALADALQSSLSDQISQTAQEENTTPQTNTKANPATATSNTGQAQAAINLAMSSAELAEDYAGQGSYDRTNSLLLATAAARHEEDMAKLDADYEADLIAIYNAELNARLWQVVDLDEANRALGAGALSEQGFATISPGPPGSSARKHIGALGAWSASQDEGEIPYQVLQAKEVQLLRAQSVKRGQLSAQGYENVIKPVLAELDAYGKGGITTQTIVQALGFIGVISSISVK